MNKQEQNAVATNCKPLDLAEKFAQAFCVLSLLTSALISGICFSAILYTQRYNFPFLPIALILIALPVVSRKSALYLFTLSLPLFGNRPGSNQAFYLFLVTVSLNIGFVISLAKDYRTFFSSLNYKNPILFLSLLYLIVSVFSLSSLPLGEFLTIFKSQVPSWTDFSAFSYVFLNMIGSTEDKLSYSIFSVVWTTFSFNLMLLTYHVTAGKKENIGIIFSAILAGLVLTLLAGLLDYYSVINLSGLRTLDPVVNPGGVQFRMQSFFGHSGWFAEYVTLCIPFTMIILRKPFNFSLKLAVIIAILLLGELSLILSFQRGGWISYPLTLLVVWASIYAYQSLENSNRSFLSALKGSFLKIIISIPLTLLATFAIFFTLSNLKIINTDRNAVVSRYVDRFNHITKSSDRTDFMKAGLKLGSLYPILGAGSESFAYNFNKEFNKPDGAFYQQLNLPLYGSSHNVYMQIFSGKGIAGLLLLLAIIGYAIVSSFRLVLYDKFHSIVEKIYLLSIASFCFAFLIYGNVQELFYVQMLQYLFFIVLGLAAVLQRNHLNLSSKARLRILSLVIILICAHFAWLYLKPVSRPTTAEYGCFDAEKEASKREFRWCSPTAIRPFPVHVNANGNFAQINIEAGHIKNSADKYVLEIWESSTLLHSKDVAATKKYKLDITLPPQSSSRVFEINGEKFINLRLKTNFYFIPVRDLDNSEDFRVLSYKLYNSDSK